MSLKGSCLCGSVQYQVQQLDMPIVHCHCQTCQKAHSAAMNTTAGVLREHFQWTQGEGALHHYESSPGKVRHFCGNCGSHLMAERVDKPHVVLRIATLDDDPGLVPQTHIWCSHDKPWLDVHSGAYYPEWAD